MTVTIGQTPRWYRTPRRRENLILCLHTTEGTNATAVGVNSYDARRADQVSAHYLVDATTILVEVPQDAVSFAMAPWNDVTTNVEICGQAAQTDWDPRITDAVVELMAHEWKGPLTVLTPDVIIGELSAGGGIPAGVSCHRWLNTVTRHFGLAYLAPALGFTGNLNPSPAEFNAMTSHTDPGDALIGRIPELTARAAKLRTGPGPTPYPSGGKTVLTKFTVTGHWAVFYGDMDEQGICLSVFHAGPRLNAIYDARKSQTYERTRESMKDFAIGGQPHGFSIEDAPGIAPWTAADFYQGD